MGSHCLEFFQRHKTQILVLLIPVLLLPLPIAIPDEKGRCGYMLLLMATLWCTEAVPLAVTGFIPVFLAPLFNILSTKEVCANYFRTTIMLFLGGIIVALAIENSNLHKRIALKVLLVCGTKPRWLMFGAMLPAWFLSMWISNTATTAMMLPIIEAILQQLDPKKLKQHQHGDSTPPLLQQHEDTENIACKIIMSPDNKEEEVEIVNSGNDLTAPDDVKTQYDNFCKVMTLAVTYAANVGGIAALTGTSPNVIMTGQANSIWEAKGLGESPVNYTTWMVMGMPVALINVIIVWVWLQFYHLGFEGMFPCVFKQKEDPQAEERAHEIIQSQYDELGTIKFAEGAAGVLFMVLVFLWFFRAPGFMPGWAAGYEFGWIADAVPAMLISFLLFTVPYVLPKLGKGHGTKPVRTLLDWEFIHRRYPWSVIFIMGGGFALAESCNKSGLSQWMGDQLAVFGSLPPWIMMFVVCFLVTMLTQITTNSATCTIMMPVLAAMSESLGKSPLYLMFPAAISCSFSYMLPVSNPPNAIAFSYGRLKIIDMAKAGFVIGVLGVMTVTIATQTWGMLFFQMDVIPWAVQGNVTEILSREMVTSQQPIMT